MAAFGVWWLGEQNHICSEDTAGTIRVFIVAMALAGAAATVSAFRRRPEIGVLWLFGAVLIWAATAVAALSCLE